jgi:predicted dehydrogenase
MSHDLDLVLWLMGEFPQNVSAKTETLKSPNIDKASARLEFTNGYAELSSSRVAETSERIMELRYPSGTVHIDFNKKTLRHDTPFDLDFNFAQNPAARDSLDEATQSFVQSILHGAPIAITAQDGYDAVRLAVLIDEANT